MKERRRRMSSQPHILKKCSLQTHFRSQTSKTQTSHTRTHTYNTDVCVRLIDAIYQSKLDAPASLPQHWLNPKSTWLKLSLSNSAQIVSVTSKKLFALIDGTVWHLIVKAWLWQVCTLVHIATHKTHRKSALIFVSSENVSADISLE